jgi:hypothetical protein
MPDAIEEIEEALNYDTEDDAQQAFCELAWQIGMMPEDLDPAPWLEQNGLVECVWRLTPKARAMLGTLPRR